MFRPKGRVSLFDGSFGLGLTVGVDVVNRPGIAGGSIRWEDGAMARRSKYSAEVRERAVRMVLRAGGSIRLSLGGGLLDREEDRLLGGGATMRRLLRSLVIVILAVSPLVWLGSYLAVTRTDAYAAATEVVKASPSVRAHLGEVDRYRLTLFDGFRYSTFGTDAEAHFRIRVTGSRQDATVYLHLERKAGSWVFVGGNLVGEQGRIEAMAESRDSRSLPAER